MSLLKAEVFKGPDFVEHTDEESFEIVEIDFDELESVELERDGFINVRQVTKMLSHIIDENTEVWYPGTFRTRFEVRNGFKTACLRGAQLDETTIYNLMFRCRGKVTMDGIAAMTFGPQGEEWIMLCPDDTNNRVESERKQYLAAARHLVFSGLMDPDLQSQLVENLDELNIGSRCANSLIHEYGHVLQYRMWYHDGIDHRNPASIYEWFYKAGYATNVSNRIPHFDSLSDDNKILFLKEGFVEDYRIGLNIIAQNGKFELPNAFCFRGDFENPQLMQEGVDIVKKTLQHYNTQQVKVNRGASNEPDRVSVARSIMSNSNGFRAGHSQMSAEDHKAVIERLRQKQLHLV